MAVCVKKKVRKTIRYLSYDYFYLFIFLKLIEYVIILEYGTKNQHSCKKI